MVVRAYRSWKPSPDGKTVVGIGKLHIEHSGSRGQLVWIWYPAPSSCGFSTLNPRDTGTPSHKQREIAVIPRFRSPELNRLPVGHASSVGGDELHLCISRINRRIRERRDSFHYPGNRAHGVGESSLARQEWWAGAYCTANFPLGGSGYPESQKLTPRTSGYHLGTGQNDDLKGCELDAAMSTLANPDHGIKANKVGHSTSAFSLIFASALTLGSVSAVTCGAGTITH